MELGTGAEGQKTKMIRLLGRRSLTIPSAVWIQCTNVMDGRTDTGPQERLHLRITSRGKNSSLENLKAPEHNVTIEH